MDIAGYSHYENVCSNILAFYFDPKEDHGLGDLMIRSLFSLHDKAVNRPVNSIEVIREYPTSNGGRLDLVLSGEGFVVGIENKIYHWLANDLEDYGRTIDVAAGTDKEPLKYVLGLRAVAEVLPDGFQSITYEQFWEAVEDRMGPYLSKANHKWLQYLLDFIQTTRNLTSNAMNESLPNDQFFIENNEVIERLFTERTHFIERLNHKVSQLKILVCEDPNLRSLLTQDPWIYLKSVLVLDFIPTEDLNQIALDLGINPNGWELTILGRGRSESFLAQLIQNSPQLLGLRSCERAQNGRRIVKRWDLEAGFEEIYSDLAQFAQQVCDATRANQEPVS